MSKTLPRFNRADVREEAMHLLSLGFEYIGFSGTNHPVFEHPRFGRTRLPLTPSETQHWQHNFRAKLASQMGLSKSELELRLGIRQKKHTGPKVRRKRNERGRQARKFAPAPAPAPAPATERLAEIPTQLAKVNHTLRTAMPGSSDAKEALATCSSLTYEYLQLEADLKAVA